MHMFTNALSLRVVALASMVLLGACSKKGDDPTPTPTPTPTTTYATTWTADSKNYSDTGAATVNSNKLTVSATQTVSSSESYTILLNVPAAAGNYNLTASGNGASYVITVGGTTTPYTASPALSGTSGTVTVATFSATEVTGTFSFTASTLPGSGTTGTKTVSNGKFAIKR